MSKKNASNLYAQIVLVVAIFVIISRILIYFIWLKYPAKNNFWSDLQGWDVGWYTNIIINGYQKVPNTEMGSPTYAQANWAFFPLMPLIMRSIYQLTQIPIEILGPVLNTFFFLCSLIIFGTYISKDHKKGEIYYILALYAFGIYSIYFSILYTESLFLLLTILFFYLMKRKKYIEMGIVGALCSATRNIGAFLVFAVAIYYTESYLQNKEGERASIRKWFWNACLQPKLVVGVLLIPLGIFMYMLYLYSLTGDTLAFMHIQRAWWREMNNPVTIFINAITNIGSTDFYLSLFVIIWIFSIYKLFVKKQYSEMIFSIIALLIPLSTSITSIPRYMIGNFTVLLGLTNDIDMWKPSQKTVILISSSLWELFIVAQWFRDASFLM